MNALMMNRMLRPILGQTGVAKKTAGSLLQELFEPADVRFDGKRPWDITVKNQDFYRRILCHGSLGMGESYMDGWWECERPDEMVCRLIKRGLNHRIRSPRELTDYLLARCTNKQCISRAWQVGRHHYDIGDDLYRRMLDERMMYSCAYWREAEDLDEAQQAKLDLIAGKLRFEPGMEVLDIGCGWGGAARYFARRYGVKVTGVTISEKQAETARRECQGLAVEIMLLDYRHLTSRYDRIYSIGMFEHVGYKNYTTYMEKVRRLLHPEGLFLLHTIGNNRRTVRIDPWIERYIFPNAMLPSADQLIRSFAGLFILEDWHNFGADYDRTLMEWHANFETAWPELAKRYGERFRRMWKYYLLACAGSFRARKNQLWQLVLSPSGVREGYERVR